MFDSIFIGTSGLIGYSKGLRVVSNNLANVNTPGFKGGQLQFADYMYDGSGSQSVNFAGGVNYGSTRLGTGLNTLATDINFRAGNAQSTGNDLDLMINGNGYFVVNDKGDQKYTRNGSFSFKDGFLVESTSGLRIQGFDTNGKLGDIALAPLLTQAPKITSTVKLSGNIANDIIANGTTQLNSVTVIDNNGGSHSLTFTLTKSISGSNFTFALSSLDAGVTMGSPASITFGVGGIINPANSKVTVNYTPSGGSPMTLQLDFGLVSSNTPTGSLAFSSQDGYVTGALSAVTFETDGKLKATYSNGQTASGPSLALASFESNSDLRQLGGNLFDSIDANKVHLGAAKTGSLGSLTAKTLEGSNVDLAQEFSNLIVMQRGYQASSRVVSTANELIQELFDMKGRN